MNARFDFRIRALALPAAWAWLALTNCSVDERALIGKGHARSSAPGSAGADTAVDAGEAGSGVAGINGEPNTEGQAPLPVSRGGSPNVETGGVAYAGIIDEPGGNGVAHDPDLGGSSATGGVSGSAGSNAGGSSFAGTPSAGAPFAGAPSAGANGGTGAINGCAGDNYDAAGCGDTAVQNARFDTDAAHWDAESQLQAVWDARDAREKAGSGSLLVANVAAPLVEAAGFVMAAAEQCLAVSADATYQVAGRIKIPSGQGPGDAGINVWVFSASDCTGGFLSASAVGRTDVIESWVVVDGVVKTPPGSHSLVVRLAVTKLFTQLHFDALFDDVVVRKSK